MGEATISAVRNNVLYADDSPQSINLEDDDTLDGGGGNDTGSGGA